MKPASSQETGPEPISELFLRALREGRVVVLTDASAPERGSVFISAGQNCNDGVVNFMASYARGLVAVALTQHRAERLGLTLQGAWRHDVEGENYTVSIEAKDGVTTGISAADRARTIQVLAELGSRSQDLVCPGHVFPTQAHSGGVMVRPGWAEAAVDLARIAGLEPVMTFCHVLSDDGESADLETVNRLADAHKIPVVDMADIVTHRMETETFVTQTTQANLDTAHGSFMSRVFQHRLTREEHLALTLGDVRSPEPVLVRVHSECLTGDVLGSQRCDCGLQLDEAMALISKEGRGALLYLRQEGRGIGLVNKVEAYALQDAGRDTVEANIELGFEADQRDFRLGGQMLLALGIQQVKLMTNNPRKITALESAGIDVVGRLPLEFEPNESSRAYLKAKKDKLGHLLTKV